MKIHLLNINNTAHSCCGLYWKDYTSIDDEETHEWLNVITTQQLDLATCLKCINVAKAYNKKITDQIFDSCNNIGVKQ